MPCQVDTPPGDELVEHVDDRGRVIEVVRRSRMRAENLLHRSVAIVVTSSDGRLLVHRRAEHKDVFAGWWDLAAGGVVGVGESYAEAARRELAEELGITAAELAFVTSARHDDEHARELCHIFRVVHDGPFTFDDGEITEARYVTPTELAGLVAAVPFLPGSLRMIAPLVDGFTPALDHLRCTTVQRVEFTVEPFVEGQPGRHVTAPLDAVRELGIDVEFGPFGSGCTAPTERTAEVVGAIVRAALDHGATHVNIDVVALDPGDGT
jgi:isopentenyldiphosphate isomerase